MDIAYMRDDNDSRIGPDYIHKHSGIAVPYLTVICLAMVVGTMGNCLVIAAVMLDKVRRHG